MEYGVAIVPPADINQKIKTIQNQFGDIGIEPHITIKAQGGLNPGREWLEKIKRVVSEFKPFPIVLGEAMNFGNEVIFVSVNSPELILLHNKILDSLKLPEEILEKYYEGELFKPHITLGMTKAGFNSKDFPVIKALSDELFADGKTEFDAKFLRVYEFTGGQWDKYTDINL